MAVQPAGIEPEQGDSYKTPAKQPDPTNAKLAGVVDNILGVTTGKSEVIKVKIDTPYTEQSAGEKVVQKMVETVKHPNATWQLFSNLCQAGTFDKALEVAYALANPQESADALLHMANIFMSLDQDERATETTIKAFEVAKTIPNEWIQSVVLVSVSERFMHLGDQENTLKAAYSIPDNIAKHKQLLVIADVFRAIDDIAKAVELTKKALESANSIADPQFKCEALLRVHESSRSLESNQMAFEAAKDIPSRWDRTNLLTNVAKNFIALDNPKKALEAVLSIDPNNSRGTLQYIKAPLSEWIKNANQPVANREERNNELLQLATTLHSAGDLEMALESSKTAIEVAKSLSDPAAKSSQLNVADAQLVRIFFDHLESGNLSLALAVTEVMPLAETQVTHLCMLAKISLESGAINQARSITTKAHDVAHTISETSKRDHAFREVAMSHILLGNKETAQETAHAIVNPLLKSETLLKMYEANKRQSPEMLDMAFKAAASSKEDSYLTADTLLRISREYSNLANKDAALVCIKKATELAATPLESYMQDDLLKKIATDLAKLGENESARKVAESISDPRLKTSTLQTLI